MAWVNPRLSRMASRRGDVQKEVTSVSGQVRTAGRRRLREHRDRGDAKIRTERRGPDRLVSLEDDAAWAIEYGTDRMAGLYIMTGAADDVVGGR